MKKLATLLLLAFTHLMQAQVSPCPTLATASNVWSLPCKNPNYVILSAILMPQQSSAGWTPFWTVPPDAAVSGINTMTIQTNGAGFYTLTVINAAHTCTATTQFTVIGCATGVSEMSTKHSSASIFPNPANDVFTFKTDDVVKATIYNLSGDVVMIKTYGSGAHQVDLSSQSTGIYLMRLETPDGESKTIVN